MRSLTVEGAGDVVVGGSALTSNCDVAIKGSGNIAIIDGVFKKLLTFLAG